MFLLWLCEEAKGLSALTSDADAKRDAKVTELDGKLYAVRRPSSISSARLWRMGRQFGCQVPMDRTLWEKSCPAVANGPTETLVG